MKKKRVGLRDISVFIASPGDLAPERKIFKDTVDALNQGFAEGAGVRLTALGWEDVLAQTGRRVQSVINRQIEQCDVFVLVLHRRWGQDASDSPASSYTEEEFNLAFTLWRTKQSPEILIFFKAVDSQSLSDAGPQLQKVLDFRKKLEASHAALMRRFNTDIDFGEEIDRHLREYIKGGWNQLNDLAPAVNLSAATLKELDQADELGAKQVEKEKQRRQIKRQTTVSRKQEKADLSLVNSNREDLALTRAAADAAAQGRMADASFLFAQATKTTTELTILSAAAEYFQKAGELENATRLKQRQVAIAKDLKLAAQYYMDLVPSETLEASRNHIVTQMLASVAPEAAEEIRSVLDEALDTQSLQRVSMEAMVNHYTEAEIVQLARFTASPVGQSFVRKQPEIMLETMVRGQQLFMAAFIRRHPELANELQAAMGGNTLDMSQPKQLQG